MRDKDTILLEQTYLSVLEKYKPGMDKLQYLTNPLMNHYQYVDFEFRKDFRYSQLQQAKALIDSFEFGGVLRQGKLGYAVFETIISNEKVKEYARKLLAGEEVTLQINKVKFKPISQLKADSNRIMYDFGGSEDINVNPSQNSITDIVIVDKVKPNEIDEESSNGKNFYYVKANLFVPVTLPKPAQEIFVGKLFRYAKDSNSQKVLIENIDKHLLKGGILKVFEDSSKELNMKPFMLDLVKKFKLLGYTLKKAEGYNHGDLEMIILRK